MIVKFHSRKDCHAAAVLLFGHFRWRYVNGLPHPSRLAEVLRELEQCSMENGGNRASTGRLAVAADYWGIKLHGPSMKAYEKRMRAKEPSRG